MNKLKEKIINRENKEKTEKINKESKTIKIIKGTSISLIITIIALFILAFILANTDISESICMPVTVVIVGISILVGSSISLIKIKEKGMVYGGMVGLTYIIIIYLLSSVISSNFTLNFMSLITIVVAILSGIVGGIIGVNVIKK